MSESGSSIEARFRFLEPDEGAVLSEAIEAAYGDSYDVRWVYDTAEVSARLAAGTYVACVAETEDGELLCHEGMSLGGSGGRRRALGPGGDDAGGTGAAPLHQDQALPDGLGRGAGTGRHVQRGDRGPPLQPARQHRARRARDRLPARLDPGLGLKRRRRRERRGRQSAALFYTKLNDGHERPVYVPERHREIVGQTIDLCELRGTLAEPAADAELAERSELHVAVDQDHNLALITVHVPGADLEAVIAAERHHLFHRACLDAVYLDLPLDIPATALVADHLEALGVSYSGVFPNSRCDGDVLRMQSLHRVRIKADDVSVASEHGRELLEYVLADLP